MGKKSRAKGDNWKDPQAKFEGNGNMTNAQFDVSDFLLVQYVL